MPGSEGPFIRSSIHSFCTYKPSSFSQLPLLLVSEISFLPTRLPPDIFLLSHLHCSRLCGSSQLEATQIPTSSASHIHPPWREYSQHNSSSSSSSKESAPAQLQTWVYLSPHCPRPHSQPGSDWFVSISPPSDWLFWFCSSRRPVTANLWLALPKPLPPTSPPPCWDCNTLATWCKGLTHWKRPWSWERLKAGWEVDDKGWDGCVR